MDTTEESNGTYFYHGQAHLTAGELFDVIFLEQFCEELGISFHAPSLRLCTDNAVYIASAAYFMYASEQEKYNNISLESIQPNASLGIMDKF